MSQNTSSAVMAQRSEPHNSLDDFPTPPWAARALVEFAMPQLRAANVWEPAANRGYMAKGLSEYAGSLLLTDIHDYGHGNEVHDFLQPYTPMNADLVGAIITNPPFRLAVDFAERALDLNPALGFALLLRSVWGEGIDRYHRIWRDRPPAAVWQFAERVPMVKGRYDPKASSATAYAWFVWRPGDHDTRYRIIPPCRKQLERPSDYPEIAQ